jgi:hypothetical protein
MYARHDALYFGTGRSGRRLTGDLEVQVLYGPWLSRGALFRRKVAEHPALNIVFTAHVASSSHQVAPLYAFTTNLKGLY